MAHPELEPILEILRQTAERMLIDNGEFYPFAAALHRDGKLALLDTEPSIETQDVPILLEALERGLRESVSRGECRAVGVCVDSFLTLPGEADPIDALRIEIEHETGESFSVYYPYEGAGSPALSLSVPRVFSKDTSYFVSRAAVLN